MAANQSRPGNNPIAGIIGLVVMIFIVFILFQVVKSVISIMYFLGPILLIIALVLNYRVVLNYIKWLAQMIKTDTVRGLIYSALSVVGYPFVSAWLFFKAFLQYRFKRGVKTQEKAKEKEFVQYEEVEDDFLELPDLDAPKQAEGNQYDELFD